MRTVSDLMVVDRLRFPRLHRNLRTTAFTNNKKPLPSPQQPLEKTVTVKKQCGPEYSTDQNRILLYILSSTIVLLSTYLTLFSSLSSVAIYVILSLATVFYGLLLHPITREEFPILNEEDVKITVKVLLGYTFFLLGLKLFSLDTILLKAFSRFVSLLKENEPAKSPTEEAPSTETPKKQPQEEPVSTASVEGEADCGCAQDEFCESCKTCCESGERCDQCESLDGDDSDDDSNRNDEAPMDNEAYPRHSAFRPRFVVKPPRNSSKSTRHDVPSIRD